MFRWHSKTFEWIVNANSARILKGTPDAAGNGHGFFDQNGTFSQLDFPGAASTDCNGINAPGVIVGDFFDHAGVEHGYMAVH